MTQKAIEKSMQEILMCEHIQSKVIREQSRMKDVIMEYQKQKFCRVRHTTRFLIIKWYMKDWKWTLRRFPQEKEDEIVKKFQLIWSRARSKTEWKHIVASDVKNIK